MKDPLFKLADNLGKLAGALAKAGDFDHVCISCIEGHKVFCVIGSPPSQEKMDDAGMIKVMEALGAYFCAIAKGAKEGKIKPEEISDCTKAIPTPDWLKHKLDEQLNPEDTEEPEP